MALCDLFRSFVVPEPVDEAIDGMSESDRRTLLLLQATNARERCAIARKHNLFQYEERPRRNPTNAIINNFLYATQTAINPDYTGPRTTDPNDPESMFWRSDAYLSREQRLDMLYRGLVLHGIQQRIAEAQMGDEERQAARLAATRHIDEPRRLKAERRAAQLAKARELVAAQEARKAARRAQLQARADQYKALETAHNKAEMLAGMKRKLAFAQLPGDPGYEVLDVDIFGTEIGKVEELADEGTEKVEEMAGATKDTQV